jgi:NAD(P)-dependent dehydrogenase (short-subunit alcohol dehydrogenase family)
MSSWSSSYVFLTGANRGLGLEWTRQLAGRADRVFATCRRPDEAPELIELAEAHPDTIDVFALDVSAPDAIDAAAERVRETTGAVDLLLNNAGTNGGGTSDRFGSVDQETMMNVLRVNTVGPHLLVQAFADTLRTGAVDGIAGDNSVVVNVTSQLGSIANTSRGSWHSYKASKAALNMCTRLQSGALKGDGVIVVSMHPGWVRTDMGGSNARLSPRESVRGMISVIGNLRPSDSGRFLTYEGQELPW